MGELAREVVLPEGGKSGMVGAIPVRNLWLLMLYASDLFRELDEIPSSVEENPDDIPELIGEILVSAVEHRLKRNLTYGYKPKRSIQARLHGRIDLLKTERRQLLRRGRIACIYEEFTLDTVRNRYVRAALDEMARIVADKVLATRCRSLSACMSHMGVSSRRPSRNKISQERLGRHDAEDRKMLSAAHLAFNLALPTEDRGKYHLSRPDRDIHWVRKLFEKGVAGFYRVNLTKRGWRVMSGTTMNWPVEQASDGMARILPTMRTDIVLENPGEGRRIVIDTKFNAILTHGWYREESLRSQYLYQIYAYLRTQEKPENPLSQSMVGLLLHPSVGNMVNEAVHMQGHEIRFSTVDLAAKATEIRAQLLNVIE